MIVDAHLDIAYNASHGRAVLGPAKEQTPDREGIPTVGLPDLHAGGVGLVCATIFAEPASRDFSGYSTTDEAHAAGLWQMQWYLDREKEGHFKIVRRRDELANLAPKPLPIIVLLEGADPIRTPAEVPFWFDQGVRIVGLAWKQTRYAGGTGAPGPLTAEGIKLAKALDVAGIIHDASHLAEESFWQLLDQTTGPVIASHSNCRHFVPTDRQLSDDMIKAIVKRGGVIGINFFDRFLIPHGQPKRRATLLDVLKHMRHICDLAGNARHVAIGTDMDGGLGRNEIPEEITTSADLQKLEDVLSVAGFLDEDIEGIMGENWRRYFASNLA
jgi:membrane dipeptidase